MADAPPEPAYSVTCPHCGREFVGDVIEGRSERYRGFKCPHCRLFVPFERAEAREPAETARPG